MDGRKNSAINRRCGLGTGRVLPGVLPRNHDPVIAASKQPAARRPKVRTARAGALSPAPGGFRRPPAGVFLAPGHSRHVTDPVFHGLGEVPHDAADSRHQLGEARHGAGDFPEQPGDVRHEPGDFPHGAENPRDLAEMSRGTTGEGVGRRKGPISP